MKMPSIFIQLCVQSFFIVSLSFSSYADRLVMDLSDSDWGIYRDFDAEWVNDDIYPPPADIAKIPVNSPTCGWENLNSHFEKTVHLPATIEEYFWGDNTNNEGIAGDWRGVSWWVTTIDGNPDLRGKKVFLDFESVYLRAEVFVNRKLVGYDVVGNTPFQVDVTGEMKIGEKNEIAIRVTDPNGNFTYDDLNGMRWGRHIIPTGHAMGGIPGGIFLRAVDPLYISDIYVKNKPSIKDVDVIVQMDNFTQSSYSGSFTVQVYAWKHPEAVIWKKTFKRNIELTESEHTFMVKPSKAQIWDIDHPNLYVAEVSFVSDDGKINDTMTRRFGFRWFDIGEKNGDQRFYLNGRRIVQINAYSWSFWPINGVFPTREVAEKDVMLAKKLGFNMMSVHTAIPYPLAMDVADEMGLLYYIVPGGYYHNNNEEITVLRSTLSREKLLRLVKRDRSHPSLIIYSMGWNSYDKPEDDNIKDMRTAHEMDPTRIITFSQGIKKTRKVDPRKLFMKPNDLAEYYTGFYEEYKLIPSQGYADAYYNNPRDYYLYTDISDEIVYWCEDGNIGIPPRLQFIKEYYDKNGEPYGWQGRYSIEWFQAYDEFLDRSGFRNFFPDVDALTVTLANGKYYHHGRIVENIRMGNLADNYTIIGWGASQRFNHNGMVDLYRNPAGDPEIFARYCRPLYVAVKLRDKVVPAGATVVADFFIINEKDLKGPHTLTVTLEHDNVVPGFKKTFDVDIKGGEEYGQLLVENVEIKCADSPGYYTVKAELADRKGNLKAEGSDQAFAVTISDIKLSANGALADTTGIINRFLKKTCNFTLPELTSISPDPDYIIVGKSSYAIADIMDRVANGATAVVVDQTDRFAELINEGFYEALDYRGRFEIKQAAFGGNFIAGKHELLKGLPQAQAFNWEYQVFYKYSDRKLYALRLNGVKPVVAAVSDHKKEVGNAVSIIPFGRGRVILSTLAVVPYLDTDTPQSVVAKRLFMNYIEYAAQR